jgi:hypothetical protein
MNQHEAVRAAEHLKDGTSFDGGDGNDQEIGEVKVWVYVWSDDLSLLEPDIWR